MYGNKLNTSVSKLESYRRCPFSFHLTYGLKLREKDELKINALDTGSFMHEVIDMFFKEIDENNLNLKEIDICGVKSEACVYAIALQLWDLGIYPNILINYCLGDIDMKNIYIKQFGCIDNKE